ncbi:phage capsid protein [Achromobacter sp. MYb9]|uniref:GPO family capsid scaffolding protein n=1 Tax=Achromobacter sp. MYb9 TaxID=1827284 RepID=UPI000CFCDBBB|nr:GPO family capsid scaffolding protein [Achromobacter sp. MYb9]PQZ68446.1 phage capsid protein [Achromobacter sp. MYb9]
MKWFTVATEGQTTDGRVIERSWLDDIAATYNRANYGARIWMEHIRGVLPDGPFKAYGDVLAVRVQDNKDGKRELQAQLDPTPDLVALTKARQKIYTSIEIEPNFAKSGKCGLIGLSVTDSPASLGTSILEFAAKNPAAHPYAARKQNPENIFTSGLETNFDFSDTPAAVTPDPTATIFTRMTELLRSFTQQPQQQQQPQQGDTAKALQELPQLFSDLQAAYTAGNTATATKVAELASELAEFKKTAASASDLQELRETLDKTPNSFRQRPPATGGTGEQLTQF